MNGEKSDWGFWEGGESARSNLWKFPNDVRVVELLEKTVEKNGSKKHKFAHDSNLFHRLTGQVCVCVTVCETVICCPSLGGHV